MRRRLRRGAGRSDRLRLSIDYRAASPRTPVSRFVHLRAGAHGASFDPPVPPLVPGKGYPLWILEHRGHELHFASSEEMRHVCDVLGQRVLAKPRVLGAAQSAVNSHWLSRMDKAWLSWKTRQERVRRLREALGQT